MNKILIIICIIIIIAGCAKNGSHEQEPVIVKTVDLNSLKEKAVTNSSEKSLAKRNSSKNIQFAMYRRKDWKPIYSMMVSKPPTDTWNEFFMPISKNSIGYDAFGGVDNWKDIDILRIHFSTDRPTEEVKFYIDDILLMEGDLPVYSIDFEERKQKFWLAKGTDLEGSNTIVSKDGRVCLLFYGTAEEKYGTSGVEIQFDLPQMLDLSEEDYTIRFKYYVPLNIE